MRKYHATTQQLLSNILTQNKAATLHCYSIFASSESKRLNDSAPKKDPMKNRLI